MRYLLLFTLLLTGLFFNSCDPVEADTTMMKAVWDHNAVADSVTHYSLYVYETADSNTTPFVEDSYDIEAIASYFLMDISSAALLASSPDSCVQEFSVEANGQFVQVALTATNKWAHSAIAISGFAVKDYQITPQKPSNVRIR